MSSHVQKCDFVLNIDILYIIHKYLVVSFFFNFQHTYNSYTIDI